MLLARCRFRVYDPPSRPIMGANLVLLRLESLILPCIADRYPEQNLCTMLPMAR